MEVPESGPSCLNYWRLWLKREKDTNDTPWSLPVGKAYYLHYIGIGHLGLCFGKIHETICIFDCKSAGID